MTSVAHANAIMLFNLIIMLLIFISIFSSDYQYLQKNAFIGYILNDRSLQTTQFLSNMKHGMPT